MNEIKILSDKIKEQITNIDDKKELFNFRIYSSKLKLRYILDPKIEIKRKATPAPIKRQVWEKYISTELRKGKCFCCKTKDIMESDKECGHIISDKNKGKPELDNLRPICSQCNKSMGSDNMYEFISSFNFWK